MDATIGMGDDQLMIFEQVLNLSTRTLVPIARVTAEQDASEARVVTHGSRDGLALDRAGTRAKPAPAPSAPHGESA